MMNTPSKQRGYTLKELVIVVLIISILAATAIRSFRKSTMKSNRQNGIDCLVEIQKRMEDYYSRNAGSSATGSGYPTLSQIGYSAGSCPAPEGQPTSLYTVTLTQPNTAIANCTLCYLLTATGAGAQAKDGTLLLSVDPRSTAVYSNVYDKQHKTPGGTTEAGWIFSPGQ